MSIEVLQKAIEDARVEVKTQHDEMQATIKKTGEINTELQSKVVDAEKRLFDLEQKMTKALPDDPKADKNELAEMAKSLIGNWNGRDATHSVKNLRKAVTSDVASGGALIQPQTLPGILMPGLTRLTVRDLLLQGRTTSNSIEYMRENVYTNSAAPVAENTLKPESNITFTAETANVRTIAHWLTASKQVLSDAAMLESYINARLMYGLQLVEDGQLLNGDGTGQNLEGLNTVATAYDTGITVTGDTAADILAHAIYQVALSEFDASGLVLNPLDWHRIALLKDTQGNYILGGPQVFASKVLWGLPVVTSTQQAAGTFTVGGFNIASQVWDREDASIQLATQNGTDFVKNMVTILCEERLALAHYRPTAIVKGTFATTG